MVGGCREADNATNLGGEASKVKLMPKVIPVHLLQGAFYLDIMNLEEKRGALFLSTIGGVSVFIDLSQVRFAELSAITKLVLDIEVLAKKGARIYIAMPTIRLTKNEETSKNYSDAVKNNILKARKKANNFLKTVGFVKVVREISHHYQREIFLSELFEFESTFNFLSFDQAFSAAFETHSIEYYDYKYVFPLERLHVSIGLEDFITIESRLDKILENKQRGIESIDVQGIKNVIASELFKNVMEHSKAEYAIFTIGLISSNSLLSSRTYKKNNPIESNYLEWLKENKVKSQVEIYFGDAGIGILNDEFQKKYFLENEAKSRSQENQLQWAFQKWSTLKHGELRRGTKGLYRIQRIVNKYNGIFHITTGDYNGGYQKGGLAEAEWLCRKSHIYNEGTFIQIKLCPYTEVRDFRFTLKQAKRKNWTTVQYYPKTQANFIDSFISDIKRADNLLVILNLMDVEDMEAKQIIEQALPDFSFYSHPTAVVIYLLSKLKNDTIQVIAESANEYIISKVGHEVFQESRHRDAEEVYDPVLIIGEENTAFWYGGSQFLIDLLNESARSYHNELRVSELSTYLKLPNEIQIRIRLHLENDNRLVIVDNTGKLSFNFTNLDTLFEASIISKTDSASQLRYCSPKLEVINKWLNVRDILKDNIYGFALTLYFKFKHNIDDFALGPRDIIANYYILIDHKQQKELALALASLLGISHKNIKIVTEDINPNIPRRTKLFPEKSQVIILTTIISSSETVRRLVKFIRRDSGIPIVILALCNYRKYNIHRLETWSEVTPILSIYQRYKIEQPRVTRDIHYFTDKFESINTNLSYVSPNFMEEQKVDISAATFIQEDLRRFIIEKKALHFNHIGIFKDRHFTFYLDKERLLNSQSVIWKWYTDSITKWKVMNNLKEFTIYVSHSLLPTGVKDTPFFDFLRSLSRSIRIYDEDTKVYNDENIVFVEFGVMTGKTINNIINRSKQVKHLFVCILFDQSLNEDFGFYKRISSLSNADLIDTTATNFKIDYLNDLPLGFYTSENCPICEHIRALDYYKISLNYMYRFSEDRQKAIKLTESHELRNVPYPYDFYYSHEHPDHELSSELIASMFELKVLLDKAEFSTQWRIKLYNIIFDTYLNFHSHVLDSNSIIYALLYYLANEINWLQKEPLVFRDFREMLAEISFKIATMDLATLANQLETSNTAITTPVKLAIRYKYAAISLLRSTNKLKFCQSLSEILISSTYNGRLRDSLVQNTFYHILSLFKNKYNRSNSYNHAISEQLDFLYHKEMFDDNQKAVVEFLIHYNNFFYTATDLKVIKSLKKQFEKYYSTNHPDPEAWMSSIDLSEFPEAALVDLSIYKEKSTFYLNFLPLTSDLEENWMRVHNYIYANIQIHTEYLTDAFKNSTFFQEIFFDDIIKNIFDGNYLLGKTDDFSALVSEISHNPLSYLLKKSQYDSLHRKIDSDLIYRKSKFSILLLGQFPAEITSIIKLKILQFFPKLTFNVYDTYHVFYPTTRLKMDFEQIVQNIEKRKNDSMLLENVSMHISIWEELVNGVKYVLLHIKYDSTDQKNNDPNKMGGLSSIRKEIDHFGGSLEHDSETDETGFFNLKFKFLKYE